MPDSTLPPAMRVSMYQPEQRGLKFPDIPASKTAAEERLHRKRRLAAACRALALERLQPMIDASGVAPKLVSPARARYSCEHVGSEYIGWLHFQPIYDHLARTQPYAAARSGSP